MCTQQNNMVLSADPGSIVKPATLNATPEEWMDRRLFLNRMAGSVVAAVGMAAAIPRLAEAQESVVQGEWRFCRKCESLYFDGFADKGRCASGGFHAATGFNYLLTHDTEAPGQPHWRYCSKCRVLFYNGFPFKGICPAGGSHTAYGFNYILPFHAAAVGQRDWRYCRKCGVMFYNGFSTKGYCPAGGGHFASGLNFVMNYQNAPRPVLTNLEFDTKAIGFSGGIPVGGWSHLTLYPDGRYHFTGHFHVSGAPSYNVGIAWIVRSSAGQGFLFSKTGHLHGTFESGSRDSDWDDSGVSEDIRRSWSELAAGSRAEWKAEANTDIVAIIASAKLAVEVPGKLIRLIPVVGS